MREYILVMLTSGLTTYLLSSLCRQAALRWGAVAKVRSRDVHTRPIPYFGGVAMLGGVALACLLARNMPFLGHHLLVADDALTICVAGAVICAVGVLDDLLDLPALAKAAGQVLAAGIVVTGGVRMFWIPLPNSIIALGTPTSILVTVFFIVLCANAVNFIDGLDGLASGVVAIGSLAFFSYTSPLRLREPVWDSCLTTGIPRKCSWGIRGPCCWVCCSPPPRSPSPGR